MESKAYLPGRQIEVLRGITKGMTSKEIGDKLHVTKPTIDVHRKSMLKKTNSGGIADAIRFALRNGIVSIKEFLEKG
ncbi:MAG TPA: helix-turn-helix transcriptional regulator [Bacteroidia bacterium]|nr:helix-turn-helix transcriptional regulator [Bacteroidia bacterium]